MDRLLRTSLDRVTEGCGPRVRPWDLRPRIVHFGLGAFTRAHQSVYTEGADAATGEDWGIVAVEPRLPSAGALREQDGLYSVTELGTTDRPTRVVGSIVDAISMSGENDRLVRLFADPELTVVTTTITEKGYYRTPGTGDLDVDHPEVAADLAASRAGSTPSTTVVGRLAELLAVRYRAGGAPISVVSCDNMARNGRALQRVVHDFVSHAGWSDGAAVLTWLEQSVAFPQTIVDRIVPATTPGVLDAAARALGLRDEMAVAGEAYRQWVLQDSFAAPRPAWEHDGAQVVPDIAPYQLRKLRMLNGSHSALAYIGLAAGARTVADAMRTTWGEALVRALCAEVAPTLPPADTSAESYADALVSRFANPAIAHELRQIGSDGSLKVSERWLEPLRDLRAAGGPAPVLALALAAWANATRPAGAAGGTEQRFGTHDPVAAKLAEVWTQPGAGAGAAGLRQVVAALLRTVGADDLAGDVDLVAAVASRSADLESGRVEL